MRTLIPYPGTLVRALVSLLIAGASLVASADVPTLSGVVTNGEFATPNQAYSVVYEITWEGDPGEYLIAPPEVEAFTWGTARVARSRATAREGLNVLYYTLEFTAEGPGTYEIPGITFRYFTPDQVPQPGPTESGPGDAGQADAEFPMLRAEPISLIVRAPSTVPLPALVTGALLACCALAGAWVFARRRRRGTPPAQVDPLAEVSAMVHAARGRRLDGDYYAFYCEMLKAVQRLEPGSAVGALQTALKNRAREVGFKGVRPTDDEMDGVERDVERAVSKARTQFTAPGLTRSA